jgi:hypothetical protein
VCICEIIINIFIIFQNVHICMYIYIYMDINKFVYLKNINIYAYTHIRIKYLPFFNKSSTPQAPRIPVNIYIYIYINIYKYLRIHFNCIYKCILIKMRIINEVFTYLPFFNKSSNTSGSSHTRRGVSPDIYIYKYVYIFFRYLCVYMYIYIYK